VARRKSLEFYNLKIPALLASKNKNWTRHYGRSGIESGLNGRNRITTIRKSETANSIQKIGSWEPTQQAHKKNPKRWAPADTGIIDFLPVRSWRPQPYVYPQDIYIYMSSSPFFAWSTFAISHVSNRLQRSHFQHQSTTVGTTYRLSMRRFCCTSS